MSRAKKPTPPEKKTEVRKAKMLKRRIIFGGGILVAAIAVILIVCFLTGMFDKGAEISTLTIQNDGTIVSEEVETLGEDYYAKGELKSFVKKEIKEYNSQAGTKAVKLQKLSVKGDNAYLKTGYKTAGDYQAFTGYELFSGTLEEAQKAGYDLSDTFMAVKDGAKGDGVDRETVLKDKKAKVVAIRENITVKVAGKILYVSGQDTEMTAEDTVTISQTDGNQDATDLTYIIYK